MSSLGWTSLAVLVSIIDLVGLSPPAVRAQVATTITGSGLGTTAVQDTSTTWNIRGGTLSTGDTNLFHSFGNLSVGAGDTAFFQNLNAAGDAALTANPGNIANIIGRVTGGNPSNLFGTINSRTGFPNANLFLINPSGIVFGPSVSLNVGGSVHFSTADYLRLGTGNELFYADLAKDSTLTSAPVTAFGFLGGNPVAAQAIEVQGNLSLTGANTFSLIGRDIGSGPSTVPGITIDGGHINNPGGRINAVSVGTPLNPTAGGEVSAIDFNPASTSSGHGFAALGQILMTNNSFLNVTNTSGPAAGQIVIRGGQLTMEGGSRLLARTTDVNTVQGSIDIDVTEAMALTGNGTAIDTETTQSTTIPGGEILIQAGSLTVAEGAQIRATNNSSNAARPIGGNISITADTVTLSGAIDGGGTAVSSGIFSGTGKDTTGAGGNILVTTGRLEVLDGAKIDVSTQGLGNAGNIDVHTTDMLLAGVNTTNGTPSTITSKASRDPASEGLLANELTGNGGNIAITTSTLSILDGAQLNASTTTAGSAGTIDITADAITIAGKQGVLRSSISTDTLSTGSPAGSGGTVMITASTLDLQDGAIIDLSTHSDAAGGNLTVNAGDVTLSNGSSIQSVSQGTGGIAGSGGMLSITANTLSLSDSTLSTRALASGNGGLITVNAGNVTLLDSTATIDSGTISSGSGGNILLSASNMLAVQGGAITTSSSGSGNAGTVQVSANHVMLSDSGAISSASLGTGTGNAGSISISTTGQFQSTGGNVTTSADNGAGGDITTRSNEIVLNSGTSVAASTTGLMDAGNIRLVAEDRIMLQDSTVTTSASQASGGNITLLAPKLIRLRNGQIISSVQGGTGTSGGDITIDPQAVLLQNNSQILAQAFLGNGGNISITADVLIVEPGSIIDATSQLGISGQVTLQAPIKNLAGVVQPLPRSFVNNASIYGQRCAAQKGGEFSSFVQGTRDGLPLQPEDFIPSPLVPMSGTIPSGQTDMSDSATLTASRLGLQPPKRFSSMPLLLFSGCRS